MSKKVSFNPESRAKIRKGVAIIAEAVGCTMGPSSKTMLIDKGRFNQPVFSRDGVSVAKEIQLSDPEEALGARLVYEASDRTNREAGDGTTQAVILTHIMVEEGFKYIETGRNVMQMANGMKKCLGAILEQLDIIKQDISTEEQIAAVATISCREPDIGQMIAQLMTKIGPDGTITVDIKQGAPGREIEVLEGMQLDRGYGDKAAFVTDTKKMEYKAEGVYVVVTDERLTNDETQMWPITESIIRHHKAQGQNSAPNILFVAPHIEGTAENFLYLNKLKGIINPLFVKAPQYGEQMVEILQDIATYTGAVFFSSSKGSPLPFMLPDGKEEGAAAKVQAIAECAGRAERVIGTKNRTAIAGGFGHKDDIQKRIDLIRGGLSQADSNFNEEMMKERLARLTTGVGVIRVSAATDTESEELRQRVDDALSAAKAAVEEGILPGGGVALLRALQGLAVVGETEDEQVGINIVKKACRRPAWQIASVAGENADEVVASIMKPHPDLLAEAGIKKFTPSFGYNVAKRRYEDLVANGVIDPKKVVRCALLYSVTQASLILGMNGIITDIPEPQKA